MLVVAATALASVARAEGAGLYLPQRLASAQLEGATDLFADPRIRRWSAAFLQGPDDLQTLVQEVEADLLGNETHPMSIHVWFSLKQAQGEVSATQLPELPGALPPERARRKEIALRIFQSEQYRQDDDVTELAQAALDLGVSDYWSMFELAGSAQGAELQQIQARAATLYPGDFGLAWSIPASGLDGATVGGGAAQTFRDWRAATPRAEAADIRQAVHAWLEHTPNDTNALRRMYYQYIDTQDFETALDYMLRAEQAYPFIRFNTALVARGLALTRRFDDLPGEIEQRAARSFAPEARDRQAALSMITGLRIAGELGKARAVALEVLEAFPDDPDLALALALVVRDEARPDEVVELLMPVATADPAFRLAHQELATALNQAGRHAEGAGLAQAWLQSGQRLTVEQINTWRSALLSLGRAGDTPQLLPLVRRDAPDAVWVEGNFAFDLNAAGRSPEAFELLAGMTAQGRFTGWTLARLADYARDTGREDEAREVLEAALRQFPHSLHMWRELARLSPDAGAIWQRAREAAPRSAFGWVEEAREVQGDELENWAEAVAILNEGITALEAGQALSGELSRLYDARAITRDGAIRHRRVEAQPHAEQVLDDIEMARHHGLGARNYWLQRRLTLGRIGPSSESTEAVLKAHTLNDEEAWKRFFDADVRENLRIGGYAFVAAHEYLDRAPRDGSRLREVAERHARWGGSPVVALDLLERNDRANPGTGNDSIRGSALSSLGLYREAYELRYSRAGSVSPSDRYVRWLESARASAHGGAHNVLSRIDFEAATVVLRRPDGIMEERRYHPVTGALTYLRVGAAWVEFTYRDGLHLTEIRTGTGQSVRLGYDDGPLDPMAGRNIVELQADGHEALYFTYNEQGLPVHIRIEGIGAISVEYDAHGEILRVEGKAEGEGGSDTRIALQVTQAFQQLLSMIQLAEQQANFSELPFEDEELDALRDGYWSDLGVEPEAALALARDLYAKRAAQPGHAAELFDTVRPLIFDAIDGRPGATSAQGLEAVGLWHAMARDVFDEGLPQDEWRNWLEMRDWALEQGTDEARALAAAFAEAPLRRLSTGGWLRNSFLSNPGLWRHHRQGAVVPPALEGLAATNAVLVRANGDLLVGTQRGLSVMRRGFWEWHGFDRSAGRFSPNLDYDRAEAYSTIHAMFEDDGGALWLGTAGGLMRLGGDYTDPPEIRAQGSTGMPEGAVSAMAATGETLWVGGAGGLARVSMQPDAVPALESREAVLWLRAINEDELVIGRQDRVELIGPDGIRLLSDEQLTDIIVWQGRILAIRGAQVLEGAVMPEGPLRFRVLPEQETIAQGGRIYGFSEVPVFEGETALGVRTDQGVSLYRDERFEHFELPGQDRIEPVSALDVSGHRLLLATQRGVSVLEEADARLVLEADVTAMLTRPDLGATLVASSWGGIRAIDHQDPFAPPQPVTFTETTAMTSGPDGTLLVNDGARILRMTPRDDGQFDTLELFDARPGQSITGTSTEVRQILVDRENTIWVLTGPSLFRLREGESQAKEFSVFLRQPYFDVRSDMLSRLVETTDGRILLVASNEAHRIWNGIILSGGLFEYDGEGFHPVGDDVIGGWFLTGYTPLEDGRAIVGTNSGFAIHSQARFQDLRLAEDASYLALRSRELALHLGTEGVHLGDGLYLFGTAGGVVGYRDGVWFYPERLNWMLPAQQHAAYGGRAMRGIETDPLGRIYMATDFGVTVYDPRGAGPEAFLIGEAQGNFAFSALESRKMAEVSDILLEALPPDSDAGQRLEAFREIRRQLARLEEELALGGDRGGSGAGQIERRIAQLRQRDIAFLADLERSEPALFAMLQINPLDLQALGRELPDGVAVLQFLPGERALYLNLISREGQEIRQVDVTRQELEAVTRRAATALAEQAAGRIGGAAGRGGDALPDGGDLSDLATLLSGAQSGGLSGGNDQPAPDEGGAGGQMRSGVALGVPGLDDAAAERLNRDLAWLYDQLLRPVEHALAPFDLVLVAPTGVLSYVPAGALVRDLSGPRPRYAVQDFTFGKASSLYSLQSHLRHVPGFAFGHLVFGDPDGSLPGARSEAEEIARLLADDPVDLKIGETATIDALIDGARDARFLHLAMHGKLDHRDPRNSYLLLADGHRLTLPQIMTLPLANAELVFLSACETGLGVSGIEHRTIAQAFNHAGAPSIIATHWEVEDTATRELALGFYAARQEEGGSAFALARAQRAMIARSDAMSLPGYWSGFSVFGKP
ncbi:CHAT domain-containing protein [Alkalilacustris brevis]|uniref:CHAT domain-containing protein n=1 Tax=Alkalilacustris brevis TaxID=2026338 RepID=UPI001390027B|nr:CHAT domain-containing protein [Alkalilacustris brevis]